MSPYRAQTMSSAKVGATKVADKLKAAAICFSERRLKFILFSFSKVSFADFTLSTGPTRMTVERRPSITVYDLSFSKVQGTSRGINLLKRYAEQKQMVKNKTTLDHLISKMMIFIVYFYAI